MKLGLDVFTIRELRLDPVGQLDWIRAHGFEGAQFGPLGSDVATLRRIRQRAEELGLYSHVSIESPNIVFTGEEREHAIAARSASIRAAAAVGWHELHTALGNEKTRFEHAVPWPAQRAAVVDVLSELRPVLMECGSRLNIENHGDLTTFELVRLCEEIGPRCCGICLDTANVLVFAEDPLLAVRRAAPYTHLTHLKDAIVYFSERGLVRQCRPPGDGVIDWETILSVLHEYEPELPLSVEDHKWLFEIPIFSREWHDHQADLSRDELSRVVQAAWNCQRRIQTGEIAEPAAYESIPYLDEMDNRLRSAREHLGPILKRIGGQ